MHLPSLHHVYRPAGKVPLRACLLHYGRALVVSQVHLNGASEVDGFRGNVLDEEREPLQ